MEGSHWATTDHAMITGIMFVVAILFGLKIAWNIFTPIALAWGAFKNRESKTGGVSLMPFVEIVLLLVLILLSALSHGSAWFHRPPQVALWGVVAIVGSYVLLVTLGFCFGWLVVQIKKRRE